MIGELPGPDQVGMYDGSEEDCRVYALRRSARIGNRTALILLWEGHYRMHS